MSARRFDSPLRYLVDSSSRRGVEHLVELDAYNGNGKCACENFQYRLEPLLKAGAKPSNATRCHHCLEARDQFIDDVMDLIKAWQKETGHARKDAYHNV
jgi:hypothetical protein